MPIFHRYVCHDTYIGNAYALALNSNILRRLSAATINPPFEDGIYTTPDLVASSMARWLKTGCGWDGQRKLTPAGKNYATFDLDFLKSAARLRGTGSPQASGFGPGSLVLAALRGRGIAR